MGSSPWPGRSGSPGLRGRIAPSPRSPIVPSLPAPSTGAIAPEWSSTIRAGRKQGGPWGRPAAHWSEFAVCQGAARVAHSARARCSSTRSAGARRGRKSHRESRSILDAATSGRKGVTAGAPGQHLRGTRTPSSGRGRLAWLSEPSADLVGPSSRPRAYGRFVAIGAMTAWALGCLASKRLAGPTGFKPASQLIPHPDPRSRRVGANFSVVGLGGRMRSGVERGRPATTNLPPIEKTLLHGGRAMDSFRGWPSGRGSCCEGAD